MFIDIKYYLIAKMNYFSLKKYIFIKLTLEKRGEKLSVLNYIRRKLFDINPLNKTITCTDAFHNQRMFKLCDVIGVE
ncbi:hypothetical protein COE20_20990 [Bacillus cereus]|nr:hypothetical protein CON03_17145 [Bacillus cereus]PGY25899.1 hypothetical protein COE20_20990 [Bacillus cereus]